MSRVTAGTVTISLISGIGAESARRRKRRAAPGSCRGRGSGAAPARVDRPAGHASVPSAIWAGHDPARPCRSYSMFIQTEQTANPATLKFLPGREVMPDGVATGATANFPDATSATRSPLAERLFDVEGVTGLILG